MVHSARKRCLGDGGNHWSFDLEYNCSEGEGEMLPLLPKGDYAEVGKACKKVGVKERQGTM